MRSRALLIIGRWMFSVGRWTFVLFPAPRLLISNLLLTSALSFLSSFSEERMNCRRVHIRRRRNRARTAIADVGEQERFTADKDVEARNRPSGPGCERIEKRFGIIPITRAVFHSGDGACVSFKKALYQSRCDTHDRDCWDMIQINFQTPVADTLHDFAEISVETFFSDFSVIKRRKHQHAGATVFYSVRCELDRLANRAAASARHHF